MKKKKLKKNKKFFKKYLTIVKICCIILSRDETVHHLTHKNFNNKVTEKEKKK